VVLFTHLTVNSSKIKGIEDDKRDMGRKLGIAQEFMVYRQV
jgi:hypothetical protein